VPAITKSYGQGRIHKNVSYADVERAAIGILKSERRPTVQTLRAALGGGSPDTIGNALRRFWRDLGARVEGDPAALARMPAEIAEIADGMWQRALALAGAAAKNDDNAARERLHQLQLETEIRQRSFELREQEIDTQARQRESALADARNQLLALSKSLSREQTHNEAMQARIADLSSQLEKGRAQLASLIASALTRSRARPESLKAAIGSATARRKRKPRAGSNKLPPRRNSKTAAAPRKRSGAKQSRNQRQSKARLRKR
jgi:Plasmid replication region DNA-binding N-term